MKTAERTLAQLRSEFRKLQKIALYSANREAWMAAVRLIAQKLAGAGAEPSPEQWLAAAEQARTTCSHCRGSGRYSWGACVNGKMSHSGPCFRCGGQGTQGQADYRRNYGYDNHAIVQAFRGMCSETEERFEGPDFDEEPAPDYRTARTRNGRVYLD